MGKVIRHKESDWAYDRTYCGLQSHLVWIACRWNHVTCGNCKRSKPKPKVHMATSTFAVCSRDLLKRPAPNSRTWKQVTCDKCLQYKPKRRKR